VTDPLDHPLLTTMGLCMEAHSGLSRALERRLDAESGLSIQWFEVLLRLARSPGERLRMSELAAQTTLSPSGLTRAIDRLEGAGLVRREACPDDRRSAWATLSPAGRERLATALPRHLEQLSEVLEGVFTPAELTIFSDLLRRLRDAVIPCAGDTGRDEVAAR
jgi:MarR family transcriptional regulator, 2-MHQ and catechol-resistance regulon repressor